MSRLLKRLLTQSFPSKRDETPDSQLEATEVPSEADRYESRAFEIWWELVRGEGSRRVLDLGVLRAGTLNFFAEHGIDLGVVGLDTSDARASLVAFNGDSRFHGALLWDLPNYLDEEELTALGDWLADRLVPNAPVYLALATRTPYAERPLGHEIVDARNLRGIASTAPPLREVIISGPRLDRLWPRFETERSFLLRNGMQEFVWKLA